MTGEDCVTLIVVEMDILEFHRAVLVLRKRVEWFVALLRLLVALLNAYGYSLAGVRFPGGLSKASSRPPDGVPEPECSLYSWYRNGERVTLARILNSGTEPKYRGQPNRLRTCIAPKRTAMCPTMEQSCISDVASRLDSGFR